MQKIIFTLSLVFLLEEALFSQIIIDDFNDNFNTNWVPGSSKYTLNEEDNHLKVTAAGTGANYEGFGKTFPKINMTKHTIIKMKIMVPTGAVAPRIRMDVQDNNGFDTNANPITINTIADSIYYEYSFNFVGKFNASWPYFTPLNPSKITRVYFYTSVSGSTHTGSIYIDDIILENAQSPTIISSNVDWKYYNDGTLPAANWMDKTFDDSGWPEDSSKFGYGEADESTVLDFGGDINNKYTTTYFRKSFKFIDTTQFKNIALLTLVDDGAIFYLNGVELIRENLPTGPISNNTFASSEIENTWTKYVFNEALLDSGDNVLAVEVHQASANSDDLSFNLKLTATEYNTGLVRGPYLQCLSDTSIVIKWRTLENTDSKVSFGLVSTSLSTDVADASLTTNHEVTITNLNPST